MSLFKIRSFWSILCDVDEKFDQNSLVVAKINDHYDKIIIGSHCGILRIYQPSSNLNIESTPNCFQPSDLLIEKIFPDPILQVSTGRLVSGSTKVYIAVLYPKSIAVYGLVTKEGATEHGTQNMLPIIYEHKLKRSAANVCIGPFGGSQTRDFICIQSLDGLLIFFEQESFAFCCFLPQFLLPGPLIYIRKTDAFLTVSSTWHLMNFSYKTLSEAGHNTHEDDSSGAKIVTNWSYNLGEDIIDLQYVLDTFNDGYIIMLGEKHLFCLAESGILKFMKKLDYTPICIHTYSLDAENNVWSLVVSETNNLFIYVNTMLRWSAQLPFLPIALQRACFKNVIGALVLLSEDGIMHCSYLGTQPHLFTTPPLSSQNLDYEKAEAELQSLTRIIRNYYSTDTKLLNTNSETELQVAISINMENKVDNAYPSCIVSVSLTPNSVLEEAQITIFVHKPLKCDKTVEFYKNLSQKTIFDTKVYVDKPTYCPSLNLDVIVSVISNVGVPKVVKKSTELPLNLFFCKTDVLKENRYKITLDINQEAVPLSFLFPEFTDGQTVSTNEIRLKSVSEHESIVAIMKQSNKYRVYSDTFLNLNLIVQSFILRLKKHFVNENNFVIRFKEKLPINELLSYVRKHFIRVQIVNELQKQLSQLSGQFRIIQKRLITKFKDKNPTSLANMETLLEQTYSDIIQNGTQLELELSNLRIAQLELSSCLHYLISLMGLMDVDKNLIPILETAFCSFVYDIETQNWEDVLETSLCYLLRTILSRTEGEKIKIITFVEVQNIEQLELHITQVLERMHLPNSISEVPVEIDTEPEQKELLPIGSRLGESSSRAMSAKKRLTLTSPDP